jgi:hypothetical protein
MGPARDDPIRRTRTQDRVSARKAIAELRPKRLLKENRTDDVFLLD